MHLLDTYVTQNSEVRIPASIHRKLACVSGETIESIFTPACAPRVLRNEVVDLALPNQRIARTVANDNIRCVVQA